MTMKPIARALVLNWKPKVVCLLVATVLWYIIHQNVSRPPDRPDWPTPAASVQ